MHVPLIFKLTGFFTEISFILLNVQCREAVHKAFREVLNFQNVIRNYITRFNTVLFAAVT